MKKAVPDKDGMLLQVVQVPTNRDYRIPVGTYTVEEDRFEDKLGDGIFFPYDFMYYLNDTVTGTPYKLPSAEYDFLLKEKHIQWIPVIK